MPTGYTAGVVDGTIRTFNDFAKNCMRAFGATIHMRDEPMDNEYKRRIPDDYYLKRLGEAKKNIEEFETLSDEHFINIKHTKIKDDIKYYSKKLSDVKEARQRLDKLLAETEEWNPPTEGHTAFKDFMVQQLKETIKHDGDISYYEEQLNECYKKLESPIDLSVVKKDLMESYEYDLESSQKSFNEEIERCNSSNEWVDVLLKSIE